MRSFIAIPIDQDAHNELQQLQDRLHKSDADVKWMNPEKIHLTLKFLGNIDAQQIEAIKSSLSKTTPLNKPFYIHLSKVGAFPKISYPRVVWVGIDEGQEECQTLQKSVEGAIEGLGFDKEARTFTAHLTLGRVRTGKNKSQLIDCLEKERDFNSKAKVPVNKIILFQSTLTQKGSIYTPLGEFPLSQA